jgi:O-antigen ligase
VIEGVALVVMFTLGAGSSHVPITRLVAELIGLGLMVRPLLHAQWAVVYRADRLLIWLGLALAALFAAQLVPIAAGLWDTMPGHDPFAAGDRLMFGHAIARPLSLDPDETVASALFLIPALALWLRARDDPGFAARAIVAFLCFLGLSLLLAVVQVGAVPGEYHLYANNHSGLPTGLFANRNHQAMAMDCGIVLVALLERTDFLRPGKIGTRSWLIRIAVPLCVVGALLTGSRAGAALLPLALIAGFFVARDKIRLGRIELAVVLALVALAAIGLVLNPGGKLAAIFSRSFFGDDDRYLFWPAVVTMIRHYGPWGIGFGSFPYAYEVTEPNHLLSALWLNHAHNDWLEFLAESGVAGAVLALGFLVWLVLRLWPAPRPSHAMTRGAGVVIVLLLLHSGYDYPLRTVTLAALFAVMLAVMAPGKAVAAAGANDVRVSSGTRRLVVAGGSGLVAAAMIVQCIGFSAALSSKPQLGTKMPLASARASARTALYLALVHAPQKRVAAMAARAGTHGPLDEPAFTALAMVETDPGRAAALFAQAHRLSRHDPFLLSAMFDRARKDRDRAAELAVFDELGRQQMDTPQHDGALARDMADPILLAGVVDSLARGAPWRDRFVEGASGDPGALDAMARLAGALQHSAAPLSRLELAPLIGAQLKGSANDQDHAWQEWRALAPTADPLDWDLDAPDRIRLPFDWTLEGNAAPGEHGTITYDNTDGSSAIAASKFVVLSAPAYRFVATGDTPGVSLQIDCKGLATQTFVGGKAIPPQGCKVARLVLLVPGRSGTLGTVRLIPDRP